MDTLLGACYFFTVAGMTWEMVKIKVQVDLEDELKNYREYDLSMEKIQVGTEKIDPDQNYIVLAKHKAIKKDEEATTDQTPEIQPPFYSYTRPCTAPYDPTRYLEKTKLQQ